MVDFELRGNGLDQIIADIEERKREVAEYDNEIREGRGLVRIRKFPPYIPGVKALVVIVSNWGEGGELTVNRYVSLLRATYEEGYWEGEEGTNVNVVGCGMKRVFAAPEYTIGGVTVKGEPETTSDFTGSHELRQKEFVQLIVDEDLKQQEYDQIHIVGHGDTETGTGLMFFWYTNKDTGESVRHPFREEEATRISQRFQWPVKGGGVVILMGCETVRGGLLSFLNGVLSDCVVYGVPNIVNCIDWEDEETGETFAMDWYYREQDPELGPIAEKLGIPKP
jgi:hypothetical protein